MKKSICLLLLAALLSAVFSCTSCAEGANGIQTGDILWYGVWNEQPVSWTVLDADAMNSGEPGMFLFAQYVIQPSGVVFHDYSALWEGSYAQDWCETFWDGAFTEAEKTAIPATFTTSEEGILNYFGLFWRPANLTGEHVFLISAEEMSRYVGEDDGAEGLTGHTPEGKPAYYWLRSPHGYHPDYSGLVIDGNQIHDSLVYKEWGGRPAMNLDPEKLVYAVPMEDGTWKTAAEDPEMFFSVTAESSDDSGKTVQYTSSVGGADVDVVLLVTDRKGNLTGVRSLGQAEAEGTVHVDTAAENYPEGAGISLAVRKNAGDRYTDSISARVEIQR